MPMEDVARGGGYSPFLSHFPTLGNILGILFCLFMAYRGLPMFEKTDDDAERRKSILFGIIWEVFWLSPVLLCVTGVAKWP